MAELGNTRVLRNPGRAVPHSLTLMRATKVKQNTDYALLRRSIEVWASERPYSMRKFIRILVKSVLALLLLSVATLAAGVGWLVWHYYYEIELADHRQLANVA